MIDEHNRILSIVCDKMSVLPSEVKRKGRYRNVVYARMLYSHYAYQVTPDLSIVGASISKPPYSIRRYIINFDNELKYNKMLKFIKTECDDQIQPDIRG